MGTVVTTESRNALLALEARWLRYAFTYDPTLAVSIAKVDPLPHQIEAVYGNLISKPRVRFMLAHDPGAGKTIMAGLIIKEMKMRNEIRRILIVVPGQLKEQWQWEMQDKFDETFSVVDRQLFSRNGTVDAWDDDQLITSIDFAKKKDVLSSLEDQTFDLIIVDEAHKLSAYSSGSTISKTNRYKLGEVLSKLSRHLLFLTATPHKGDLQNFRLLLDLLEPGFFATDQMMQESVKSHNNPLFLRRAKEDMRDFDGKPLFVQRMVQTPDVRLSAPERRLYSAMSKYIQEQYNLATKSVKQHNIVFALIILQRRFASSTFALLQSLRRRRARLQQLDRDAMALKSAQGRTSMGLPDYVDGTEEKQWSEEEKWELITVARNRDELKREIGIIDKLIGQAENILKKGSEAKLNELQTTLDRLKTMYPDEKVLIFTESKDTMGYLADKIADWGYSVNVIHGAMPAYERKAAEEVFRSKTQIMVATEAAGEGINLQFCHLMINYDLPWNPNRLEQRMGRIHRYGQKFPVSVFNLVAIDTREGEIMLTLFEKLEEIKAAMGSDKIFDVISEVIEGKSLAQMMLDATVRSRKQSAILSELTSTVTVDNKQLMEYMKDGLATRYIGYMATNSIYEGARERQLIPEYTRDIFCRITESAGGSIKRSDPTRFALPDTILKMSGAANPVYEEATFDKRIRAANPGIDLVTFGHPVFDAALKWAESQYSDAVPSGVFEDPTGKIDGHLVFCEGVITDGSGATVSRQIMACVVKSKGTAETVSPSILLDLSRRPVTDRKDEGCEAARSVAISHVTKQMDRDMKRVKKDRDEDNKVIQKYGIRSVEANLENIRRDIVKLLDKKQRGLKVDLAIRMKRESRKKHQQARMGMRARLDQQGDIRVADISVIGILRVVPRSSPTARDLLILKSAAALEERSGRRAEIVSGTGCGFDIRSTVSKERAGAYKSPAPNETHSIQRDIKYILAKSVPPNGIVTFTFNEWFRAKTLGADYYLYLLFHDRNKMYKMQDPSSTLKVTATDDGYVTRITRSK